MSSSEATQRRPTGRAFLVRSACVVFFHGLGHVGIDAGRGKYIHAPSSGSTVRWASLASASSYDGARRIVFQLSLRWRHIPSIILSMIGRADGR